MPSALRTLLRWFAPALLAFSTVYFAARGETEQALVWLCLTAFWTAMSVIPEERRALSTVVLGVGFLASVAVLTPYVFAAAERL